MNIAAPPIPQAVNFAPPAPRKAAPVEPAPEPFEQTLTRYDKPVQEDAAPAAESPDASQTKPVAQEADAEPATDEETPVSETEEESGAPAETEASDETSQAEASDPDAAQVFAVVIEALPVQVETAKADVQAKPAAQSTTAAITNPQPEAAIAKPAVTTESKPAAAPLTTPTSAAGTAQPQVVTQAQPDTAQQQGDAAGHQQPQPQAPAAPVERAPVTDAAKPAVTPTPTAPPVITAIGDVSPSPTTLEPTTPTPAPTPASAAAQRAADGDEALNSARLARGLQSAVAQRGGSVTLRLTPPEMGTVRIQMQITAARVSVQFHAETQQGQSMLTQQLGQLRTTLESHGLQVERITVQTMHPGQSQNNASTSQQQHNQGSEHGDARADDGRSRGSFGRGQDEQRGERRNPERFDFRQMFEQQDKAR